MKMLKYVVIILMAALFHIGSGGRIQQYTTQNAIIYPPSPPNPCDDDMPTKASAMCSGFDEQLKSYKTNKSKNFGDMVKIAGDLKDYGQVARTIAVVYEIEHDKSNAKECFEVYSTLRTRSLEAYLIIARMMLKEGKKSEGIELCRSIITNNLEHEWRRYVKQAEFLLHDFDKLPDNKKKISLDTAPTAPTSSKNPCYDKVVIANKKYAEFNKAAAKIDESKKYEDLENLADMAKYINTLSINVMDDTNKLIDNDQTDESLACFNSAKFILGKSVDAQITLIQLLLKHGIKQSGILMCNIIITSKSGKYWPGKVQHAKDLLEELNKLPDTPEKLSSSGKLKIKVE